MAKDVFAQLKKELPGVQKNILLKDYTTYKIGGPAKYFFVAKTKEELITAIKSAKKTKISVLILGGGSNLLVSDKGFTGLVIKLQTTGCELKNNRIFVPAGTRLGKLSLVAAENGFLGFEWAMGIPGTVGGAIFGNAQAFGEKISDMIEEVETLDIKTLKTKVFDKEQCRFSLKNSIFKKNRDIVIISAVFFAKDGDKQKIQEKIKECLDYRKKHHPMSLPSAGSTFVNPEKKITDKKLLEKFPELEEFNKKGAIPAGYLIQKSGMQGKKIGNAQISQVHANFIVNLGGAKAKDVLSLIKLAKQKVKKTFGINLEPEIQFVGI